MTPQEFKSWFDGFTEALTTVPTKAQWARIKERVAEIDGKPVTERVFVDRYWPTYYPTYIPTYTPAYRYYGGGWSTVGTNTSTYAQGCSEGLAQGATSLGDNMTMFSSDEALYVLGRADAQSLAA